MDVLLAVLSLVFVATAVLAAIRIEQTLPTGPVQRRRLTAVPDLEADGDAPATAA